MSILCCFIFGKGLIYGQTQITIYTPKGSPLVAYNNIPEMNQTDKNDWSVCVSQNYPNATQLNPPSATRSYNCHAYTWHMTEGGNAVWIGLYSISDESIYMTDGSYVQVQQESYPGKVYWGFGTHDAITTNTSGAFISK